MKLSNDVCPVVVGSQMISASSASLRLSWNVVAQRGRESSRYRNAALPNQPPLRSDGMLGSSASVYLSIQSFTKYSTLLHSYTIYSFGLFSFCKHFFEPNM